MNKLLQSGYRATVLNIIQTLQFKWDEKMIETIVFEVDKKLPEHYDKDSIPLNRKKVIYKILTSRFKKLVELLHV